MVDLHDYGWSDELDEAHRAAALPALVPARVIAEHRDRYRVIAAAGELAARIAGRLRHHAAEHADLPAVGDWVLLDPASVGDTAIIRAVLPRRSSFSRKVAGTRTDEQVVAANIDTVWLASALDQPLSLRRIERYLAMAWESGATPAILLTKADLADAPDASFAAVEGIALGVAVHVVSSVRGDGLEALAPYLRAGRTVALLGPSGVGKSTLINRLAGEELLRTAAVSAFEHRGRHTTTHRQLIHLPGGGLIVDTPGMRELQLWDSEEGVHDTFADIDELAAGCRFADCRHEAEPGCAVLAAIDGGSLEAARLASWHKLQRELEYLDRRHDARARAEADRRLVPMMKSMRHHPKYRDR